MQVSTTSLLLASPLQVEHWEIVLHAVNNNETTFTLSICTSLKRDSLKSPYQVEELHRFNRSILLRRLPHQHYCRLGRRMVSFWNHLCANIGLTGSGVPPEDDEINKVTLPSIHGIRKSSPCGLRRSTLPLGHGGCPQYWIFMNERKNNILFSLKLGCQSVVQNPRSPTFQSGSFKEITLT